jgi:spore coat polysaccharide biosynthesis protein SpsF
MTVLIITQARYGSSRLPGKVLKKIEQETLLVIHLYRLKKSRLAQQVLVATNEDEASQIVDVAKVHDCLFYRGDLNDVLDRYYQAALSVKPKTVVRVTSDCPLIDAEVIDQVITKFSESDVSYMSNVHPPTFPDGIDIEIFSFAALEQAWKEAKEQKEREHVTPYIWGHPEKFKQKNFLGQSDMSRYRLTVDKQEDYELVSHLIKSLGKDKTWLEYVNYLILNPEIAKMNHAFLRNEGF